MYRDPRNKPANRRFADGPATIQPYRKVGWKVIYNQKFLEVYGPKKFKEFNPDPERQKFYEKKYGK